MSFIKCFDVVTMVTDEVTERHELSVYEDAIKKQRLSRCCGLLDGFLARFGGRSVDVSVDDRSLDISIAVECEDFIIDKDVSEFYDIFKYAEDVAIKPVDEEAIQITFVFSGFWEDYQ